MFTDDDSGDIVTLLADFIVKCLILTKLCQDY